MGFYLARLGNVVELTTLSKKARKHLFTQEVEWATGFEFNS